MSAITPFSQRTHPRVLCLFDVDGTLTPARRLVSPEILQMIKDLREKCVIGFVGGSDLVKQQEQLAAPGTRDYSFSENGLAAYKMGEEMSTQTFIKWLGEEKYKELVNFCLHYIADMDVPIKRGTFIEFRRGLINVSPIGRNASNEERDEFEKWDQTTQARKKFVAALKEKFGHLGLTFSIGGQISFDVFPAGWDKRYALQHVEKEGFETIHFFGDKTYEGGNDYEIYEDPRTVGHSVATPADTMRIVKELFFQ